MKLTLIPYAGLCNRMNSIVSALSYCRKYPNVDLTIKWHRWFHCNCRFKDLFEEIPQLAATNRQIKELFELNIKDVPGHKLNLHLPDKMRSFFYDVVFMPYDSADDFETIVNAKIKEKGHNIKVYVYKDNRFCIDEWKGKYADIFIPQKDIQDRIDSITKEWNGHVVGLHVRRTDNIKAIQNSPIERYYQIIDDEIRKDAQVRFYLATDDEIIKQEFTRKYGSRVITIPLCLKRSSLQGMKDAVVDLYCLASTSKIYGSSASTYSLLAGRIYGIPVIVESR